MPSADLLDSNKDGLKNKGDSYDRLFAAYCQGGNRIAPGSSCIVAVQRLPTALRKNFRRPPRQRPIRRCRSVEIFEPRLR